MRVDLPNAAGLGVAVSIGSDREAEECWKANEEYNDSIAAIPVSGSL